jgi:uncharacterized protein DUF3800
MVGVGYVADCDSMHSELEQFRMAVLADPELQEIESLKPERRKTAVHFHAKDDHRRIRDRVFNYLPRFGMKVFVAVRRKAALLAEAQAAFRYGRKLNENDIYDDLIKRLLRNRLHLADRNRVVIAIRGSKDRKIALLRAVERAKENFAAKFGARDFGRIEIQPMYPTSHAGLQAVDYYLWAVQRMYERADSEYFEKMRQAYRLIMDLDDKRRTSYGEWYTDGSVITPEKIMLVGG